MPKFSQEQIPTKTKAAKKKAGRKPGIAQEVIDSYKPFIEQLEKNHIGRLEFGANENINQGRKALVTASIQLKKYIRVRKPRGAANALEIQQITAKEFKAAKAGAKARGAKLKGVAKKTTTTKEPAKKKTARKAKK